MAAERPYSTARIGRHLIHPILVPFPIVCFVGALLTVVTVGAVAFDKSGALLIADDVGDTVRRVARG